MFRTVQIRVLGTYLPAAGGATEGGSRRWGSLTDSVGLVVTESVEKDHIYGARDTATANSDFFLYKKSFYARKDLKRVDLCSGYNHLSIEELEKMILRK